ncbi:MAG: FAD-binding domain-containing protein [Haloarculaceae archaeon]
MAPDIAVWHRDDLRVSDNPALAAASADGRVHPVFVFDPHFYESRRVCDARLAFLHESLRQLGAAYERRGGTLSLRHGDPREVIPGLLDNAVDRVYVNATTTAGYARERDATLADHDAVRMFEEDAIVRSGDSRDGWQQQAEAYFEADPHDPPEEVAGGIESDTDIEHVAAEYDVSPSKERQYRGGCDRARERLEAFTADIDRYVGGISAPAAAERRTSHLSAYFKFGCLSLREAYQYVRERGDHDRAVEMFTSRLFWNRHFTQKLADNSDATRVAVNPVFRGMNRESHDPELVAAWKAGETGFPMVDASMRALRETGWLNFRMRAMCASFYTYILRCWWKEGADWFYRHLIDADPAINYQQWQMQSGLVGVHPLRIYNPRKQVRENDPDGEFIRTYVPELADLPTTFLDDPSKAPLSVQDDHGVRIGEDYPYPVVDFERRRREARETWAALDDRAREALQDPDIRRRASLSQRRDSDRRDGSSGGRAGQATLDDFGG